MSKPILTVDELKSVEGLSSRAAAVKLGVGKSTINDARARLTADTQLPVVGVSKLRIAALDIENTPNLAHVWKLWDNNVSLSQLREVSEVFCFGYRWLGDDDTTTVWDRFHDGKDNMLDAAWRVLDESDAIMGWNSKNFDVKHLNREFLLAGKNPPMPHVNLDLMQDVKANFRFVSNKLDHVAEQLGLGNKVKHSGHDLWVRCMENDPEAWDEMVEYQMQDVDLLIGLYHKLLPWLKSHPNAALYNGVVDGCIRCASRNLVPQGYAYTTISVFDKYRCNNCGTPQRGSKRVSTAVYRKVTS